MVYKNFFAPSSLEDLSQFFAKAGDQCGDEKITYLAGGTDLVIDIHQRNLPPCETLIYLDRLSSLKTIQADGNRLRIGSNVTFETLSVSPGIAIFCPVLAQAAAVVGSPAIRAMGTIGGNVARSSPAGDGAVALLSLDAQIHTLSPQGPRQISHREFHLGPRKNMLRPGELITHFSLERPAQGRLGSSYEKLGQRKSLSIAIVSCGVVLGLDPEGQKIEKASISLGSAGPVPYRASPVEAVLNGQRPSEELFSVAAEVARENCRPIADIRAGADYRKEMVRVLTLRGLCRAWQAALTSS